MPDDLWHKHSVIYSLDLESFMDSNGDGVGDFEGLSRRLDYLQNLGVDVLWLAPFHPTPNRDNGYDISDYYGVDPRHGSSGDFVEFIHQAKGRGLKVIIDLVVNHTSDQHRWFQESRSDPDSPYRDWYVWSKKRPRAADKGMVFPGVQESTWTRDAKAGMYYFHRFHEFQPDLNMQSPAVREEIRRIMGFWLELGVAGFRVDAVPFILEKPNPHGAKHPLHFDYLKEMREFLQWRVGNAVFLGEANVLPKETKHYFADGNGIHMMFNFWVNQHLFYALASGDVGPLSRAMRETRSIPPTAQWANFLRNHDELDLGRLEEEQRQLVFDRFGPKKSMQLYGRGLRRRLAPMLGDRPQLELAYSAMFALPGTPMLRYGDEIGMGEDLRLPDRQAVRTPMQWTAEPQAGFSTAKKLIHPVVDKGPFGYERINVEQQRHDGSSLLRWMMRMIRVRKECPEIGWGSWNIVTVRTPGVLAVRYDWKGNSVLTVHNFTADPVEAKLRLEGIGGDRLVNLLEPGESRADGRRTHRIVLESFGYRWYRVGGPNYALRRERTPVEEG